MQLAQPLLRRYQRSAHPLAEQGSHLLGLLVHQGCGRRGWEAGTMSKQGVKLGSTLHGGTLLLALPHAPHISRPGFHHPQATGTHKHTFPEPPASLGAHRGRAACRQAWAPASWCTERRGRAPGPGTAPSPAPIKAANNTCQQVVMTGTAGPATAQHITCGNSSGAMQNKLRQWRGPHHKSACGP